MADVIVSLATSGKQEVTNDFKAVENAGKQMGETFGSIAGKLAGLAAGYLSVTATIGAFNGAMNEGGRLSDFSDQTGIAVDKLVLLERAFENNGLKADDLGKTINKMQKFLVEAGDSGSESADKLHKLGLFSSELLQLSPDEQFRKIAETVAAIQDPALRAATSMEIFGKSGGKLMALFSDLPGQVAQASNEVGSYASIMEKNARAFDMMGDGITAIGHKLVEFAAGALSNVGGGLEVFINALKNFDAAGFGQKVTSDLKAPIQALADSLLDGNFKQALEVAYELAKLQGMKMGNEISRLLQASFASVGTFAFQVFAPDGPIWTTLWNGTKNAGTFIAKTFQEAFLQAGSAAHAWVNLAISAMKMDLPGVIAGFSELQLIHEQFKPQADKAAKSWESIARSSLEAGKASYDAAGNFFDVASQQEKVQSMSEKIVADHEAMASLTATIAANGKKYEQSLVGVSESFGKWKAKGGEAGSLAEMAGLSVPEKVFKGTGLGPIDVPEPFSTKMVHGTMSTGRATDTLKDAMGRLLRPEDYMSYGGVGNQGGKATWDQIQMRMDTRAEQQVQSDLSSYTGGDSRASKSQAIDDLFNKYQRDGVGDGGSRADLRKRAERDFEDLVKKQKGPDSGVAPGYDNKKGGKPPESQESILAKILKALGGDDSYVKKICNERLPIQVLA